jgi:hypothetical protein
MLVNVTSFVDVSKLTVPVAPVTTVDVKVTEVPYGVGEAGVAPMVDELEARTT